MNTDVKLSQARCMYKQCKRPNTTLPVRYKIYDGTFSCRCRWCGAVTEKAYLKGQLLYATVLSDSIKREGGGLTVPFAVT